MPDRPKTGTERNQAEQRRLLTARRRSTLKQRREEVGLSQAELGQLAGVHRATVRQAETSQDVSQRTILNLMLALGCVPTYRNEDQGLTTPTQVFTAGLTKALTRAILGMPEIDSSRGMPKVDLSYVLSSYLELVMAAGNRRYFPKDSAPPPQSLRRLRNLIAPYLLHSQLADFDSELADIYGADYPLSKAIDISPHDARHEVTSTIGQVQQIDQAIPITPTPRSRPTVLLPDAVVGAVVQSGLPDELQQVVLKSMIQRQAKLQGEMAKQMDAGVKAMIAATHRAIEGFRESFDLPDDPDSREAISRALAATLEKVFEDIGWTEPAQTNAI
jgi:transcriptional regulator with XRE-family HTH domain